MLAHKTRRTVAAAGVALLALMPAAPSAFAREAPASFADLAASLTPAVVNVSTTQDLPSAAARGPDRPQAPPGSPLEDLFRDFFERQMPNRGERGGGDRSERSDRMPRERATSLGSGFIIDPSGYIVTNNHVVAEASAIKVTLADDRTLDAKLIGRDTRTDLALLKVETDRPLPAVRWGQSDGSRVGDWVLAIGNPFGLGGTVTAGIISARARVINAGPYDDFIQTDAAINRGNSGGPLFNVNGEVIGINTAIYSPSGGSVGIGFAIPSALAQPVIDQLRGAGRVTRGWLGVQIQAVTPEIAQAVSLDRDRGALVAGVQDKSPAAAASIKAGDVIVKVNNETIPDTRRLQRIVANLPPNRAVDVTVWRDGREVPVKVQIGELPEENKVASAAPGGNNRNTPPQGSSESVLGLTLAPVSPDSKRRFQLGDDAEGVIVAEVKQGSPAAEKGLRQGDLIVEVDRSKVNQPGDVSRHVRQAAGSGKKSVLMLVERDGNRRFLALPTGDNARQG